MARIAGVDIPNEKRVEISLRYIFGIGADQCVGDLREDRDRSRHQGRDLTDAELNPHPRCARHDYVIEGDLRREVRQNIQRLIEINCYRGIRHRRGLPVRGQRTRPMRVPSEAPVAPSQVSARPPRRSKREYGMVARARAQ